MGDSAMNLAQHYDDKYRDAAMDRRPIRLTRWPADRYEAAFAALTGRSGSYLEIGAGEGRLAEAVGSAFQTVCLVELSESRVQQLRERFVGHAGVTVLAGDIESGGLDFPPDSFDVIVMVAVIEHLLDPLRALVRMRSLLRPGGVLLVETPNVAKYTRRLKLLGGEFPSTAAADEGLTTYGGHPVDLFDEGHLHYFTYRCLERLCLQYAGFRSVEKRWYGRWATTRAPALLARWFPTLFSECFIAATK